MELNDLPEDCLLYIFDYFPNLQQLLSLSTVCSGWNNLIKRRLKKIHYLHLEEKSSELSLCRSLERFNRVSFSLFSNEFRSFNFQENPSYKHIYVNDPKLLEKVNVSKLLPNLKFFTSNCTGYKQCMGKATTNVLSTSNTLIGFKSEFPSHRSEVCSCCRSVHIDEMVHYCENLEYLSSKSKHFIRSFFTRFGNNLKHFEAWIDFSEFSFHSGAIDSFARILRKMPNLEALSLLYDPKFEPLKGPAPKMNLKQLKIEYIDNIESSTLQVLSLFPELPSLYLNIVSSNENETFPASRIHPNVQDLALEINLSYRNLKCKPDIEYSKLFKNILVKFPNCKNLMIRLYERCITNKLMIEIIEMLPNLNLFVQNVYQPLDDIEDPVYFNSVDRHFKTTGRRIAIYLFKIKGFGRISRYSLNEDIASPFRTDNPFIHEYFRG